MRRGSGRNSCDERHSRVSRIAPSITEQCGALRCSSAPFVLLSKIDSFFRQVVHREFQRYLVVRKDANVILVDTSGRVRGYHHAIVRCDLVATVCLHFVNDNDKCQTWPEQQMRIDRRSIPHYRVLRTGCAPCVLNAHRRLLRREASRLLCTFARTCGDLTSIEGELWDGFAACRIRVGALPREAVLPLPLFHSRVRPD